MSIRDSARIAMLEARLTELVARVDALETQARAQGRGQNAHRAASTKTRKGHR